MWLFAQLAGLALGAAGVPLAAEYPHPVELQTVRVVIAIQFAFASMLYPVLCGNWAMTLSACCFGWVMLMFAAALAAWPLGQMLPAGTLITLWLVGLAGWRAALPQPGYQLIASALATTYLLGGMLVWYVQLDFNSAQFPSSAIAYGPLLIALVEPRHPFPEAWWMVESVGGIGSLLATVRWLRSRVSGHHAVA